MGRENDKEGKSSILLILVIIIASGSALKYHNDTETFFSLILVILILAAVFFSRYSQKQEKKTEKSVGADPPPMKELPDGELSKEKLKQNSRCNELIAQLSEANTEAKNYEKPGEFIELSVVDCWNEKYSSLKGCSNENEIKRFRKAVNYQRARFEAELFEQNCLFLQEKLSAHNDKVANQKVAEAYALIGDVEGRKLDNQQMTCIVKEAHNHLVIAGAGTGKTTTVVGKIKYLLKSEKFKPEDILVLSFTNASAGEMRERIAKETGCSSIFASTFHKLGLSIIAKADGVMPKITRIKLRDFIKDRLSEFMKDPAYLHRLGTYLLYNKVPYKSEFDFGNKEEYEEYLQFNPPMTFLGERVKSYGEMDIANYLFQNAICYEYEAVYKIDTRTEDFTQYHPDFYLPDYDVYIEYFGINKNGEVPSWFIGKDGKSAAETYRESMEWKFKLHKENDTKMVAMYSYEKMDGSLLGLLEKRLKELGVSMNPKSPDELWRNIAGNGNSPLEGLIELFETVINLLKSNAYSIEYFKTLAAARSQTEFIALVEPLFEAYDAELKKSGEIDFNDMINLAAEYIRVGKVKNPFSYVIVDEYQDISKARYNLLAELRKSKDFDLFCVGDDWQSIYRFAGSDINYILNFEKYWGKTTVSKIETTYRFTKSLIEISGSFITQNPAQIKKQIHGHSDDARFSMGEISGYTDNVAVVFMAAKIEELPKDATVFFIGRYSFDVKLLSESGLFVCQYNNETGFIDVKYNPRSDLKMCFMTAHKSKGLQADYVFIINNKNTRMGFPSRIQNDPILELLLENREEYPFAEERRLYYVALTRARVKVFVLVRKDHESIFAKELHARYENELRREQFECPLCGGRLSRKTGPYGDFFGCENYRITGCTYKRKIPKQIPKEEIRGTSDN